MHKIVFSNHYYARFVTLPFCSLYLLFSPERPGATLAVGDLFLSLINILMLLVGLTWPLLKRYVFSLANLLREFINGQTNTDVNLKMTCIFFIWGHYWNERVRCYKYFRELLVQPRGLKTQQVNFTLLSIPTLLL